MTTGHCEHPPHLIHWNHSEDVVCCHQCGMRYHPEAPAPEQARTIIARLLRRCGCRPTTGTRRTGSPTICSPSCCTTGSEIVAHRRPRRAGVAVIWARTSDQGDSE